MQKLIKSCDWQIAMFALFISALLNTAHACDRTKNLIGSDVIRIAAASVFLSIFVYFIIYFLLHFIREKKVFESGTGGISFVKTFFMIWSILTLVFVTLYPGIVYYDAQMCILQYFGIENPVSEQVNLLNASQLITDHHRIAYVYLIGSCLNIGKRLFDSYTIGYAIYTFIQYTLWSASVAYAVSYLSKKMGRKRSICFTILFLLTPLAIEIPFVSNKDSIFTCFFIMFGVELLKLLDKEPDFLNFTAFSIGMFLFRGNAFYALIPTFLILLIYMRDKRILISLGTLVLLFLLYSSVLLPSLNIAGTSKKEMLSVPFQQTARYILYHEDEVTEEEKQAIDKVLVYDELKERYFPILSDPVKDSFRKECSSEDMKDYFVVWAKMGLKHPWTYIQSFLYNTYGYFDLRYDMGDWAKEYNYPLDQEFLLRGSCSPQYIENYFDIDFYAAKHSSLYLLVGYEYILNKIPFLRLSLQASTYVYLMFGMMFYSIYKKNKKGVLFSVFLLIYFMTLLLGPKGGAQRYVYPLVGSFILYPAAAVKAPVSKASFCTEVAPSSQCVCDAQIITCKKNRSAPLW